VDEQVAVNILEGMVEYKAGTWEVVNVLAESVEQSEDGLTIDFKLKEGIQFHGGYGEMTAEDVKYSYERYIDPEVDSPYRDDWANLDHVEVTGTYTGQIILKEPFAPLWTTTLPLQAGNVQSKKAIEELGADYGTHIIGTGPYEFVEWKPNEVVIIKRFEDYWGEKPEWDEIHTFPIVEDSAAEIAVETGELDFARVSPEALTRFEEKDGFETFSRGTLDYEWLSMNVLNPALADKNLRLAIRYALDVPSIIEAVHDGKWDRACALIAPGQVGYWADAPCYEQDLDLAREYLAQVADVPEVITITVDTSELRRTAAEVIQAQLAEIGLNVEVVAMDASAEYDLFFAEEVNDKLQLDFLSYSNNPDPSWATVWFTCPQVGEWNTMEWCDEEFDRLHTEALSELDPALRADQYIQMQQIWDEAAHSVWIAYRTYFFAYRTGLNPVTMPHGRVIPWAFTSQ